MNVVTLIGRVCNWSHNFFEILNRATINNGHGNNQLNDAVFDLEVYLIGRGHESRRNCFLFGKSRDLKVIIQHYPMLCFSFDSSSVAKDSADGPLRGSIWRRAGAGLVSLWRVQRKPDKGSASRPSTSQSFNGAMADPPPGTTPCTCFKPVWSVQTSIICPVIHTPASWFTCFLSEMPRNVYWHGTDLCLC